MRADGQRVVAGCQNPIFEMAWRLWGRKAVTAPKSSTFPLCDLVHQKHEGSFGPLIVEAVQEKPQETN